MNVFLLDTCVPSELTKLRPDPGLTRWVSEQSEDSFCLSVLTIGELQKGISKLPISKRRQALQEWLDRDVVARFESRILPITDEIALQWGRIAGDAQRHGIQVPILDALLAATAIVNGLTVVTRNVSDIERAGASTVNPWQG